MYLHLKESTFNLSKVIAMTKTVIPATVHTPEYYAMVIYLEGVTQPIVHTYEQEQERDEIFESVRENLDAGQEHCN